MKEITRIKSIINDNYLIDIENIEKNEESTDGNVYIIDNKYVIKIYESINKVNAMTKLHTYLKNNGVNIPSIIKTESNEDYIDLDNKYIVLYTFLNGEKIGKWFKEDNEIIKTIAKELRKIHDLTTGDNIFNLNDVPFQIKE